MGDVQSDLVEVGWSRLWLTGDAFDRLKAKLRARMWDRSVGGLPLVRYHEAVEEQHHWGCRDHMNGLIWYAEAFQDLVTQNAEALAALVRGPFAYQAAPYLRIARPGRADDNIGLHRDADYGQSEDELTVHLALTDTDDVGCIRILSGSHRTSELPTELRVPPGRDDIGMPARLLNYAADIEPSMTPVPLAAGEAIVFNARCIHGQIVNKSDRTRMAVDFRIVRADLPVASRDGGIWYRRLSA